MKSSPSVFFTPHRSAEGQGQLGAQSRGAGQSGCKRGCRRGNAQHRDDHGTPRSLALVSLSEVQPSHPPQDRAFFENVRNAAGSQTRSLFSQVSSPSSHSPHHPPTIPPTSSPSHHSPTSSPSPPSPPHHPPTSAPHTITPHPHTIPPRHHHRIITTSTTTITVPAGHHHPHHHLQQ